MAKLLWRLGLGAGAALFDFFDFLIVFLIY
jgi:hypothetical protein